VDCDLLQLTVFSVPCARMRSLTFLTSLSITGLDISRENAVLPLACLTRLRDLTLSVTSTPAVECLYPLTRMTWLRLLTLWEQRGTVTERRKLAKKLAAIIPYHVKVE
jgi:hypothetical protein